MTPEIRNHILAHASQEFPREACGLLVNLQGTVVYWPCRNTAENQRDFIMEPADFADAEDAGQILGVVHSHPNASATPSQPDLVGCEVSGLPWHIVALPSETWQTIVPRGYQAPFIGRVFAHGSLDCYALVRDWYAREMAIELPDFDRTEEWWLKGADLYEENFRAAGFEVIDVKDIQRGDAVLMKLRSPVVNHAAIYLGNDQILHHVFNRLSTREIFGGYWKKCTRYVVRYRGPR